MNIDAEERDMEVSRQIAERKRELEEMAYAEEPIKLIEGHCAKCGSIIFAMYGNWETWMTSAPLFCLECYKKRG
jgi:hypothetical protein